MPYKNPPKLPTSALAKWTHQSAEYYWHPAAQQAEHPHLHLSGSTVSDVVTVTFLKYTTGGAGGNVNIGFSTETGFDTNALGDKIAHHKAYKIQLEDLNQHLETDKKS